MRERFQKIKSSLGNFYINSMKKSKYYSLLRLLRHWAISHIEFYEVEDWRRKSKITMKIAEVVVL